MSNKQQQDPFMGGWDMPEESLRNPVDYAKYVIPATGLALVTAFSLMTVYKQRKLKKMKVKRDDNAAKKSLPEKLKEREAAASSNGPDYDSILKSLPSGVKIGEDNVLKSDEDLLNEDKQEIEEILDAEDFDNAKILIKNLFSKFSKRHNKEFKKLEESALEHYYFLVLTINRINLYHELYSENELFLLEQLPNISEEKYYMKIQLYKALVTCYNKLDRKEEELDCYKQCLSLVDQLVSTYDNEDDKFMVKFQFQDLYVKLLDLQTELKRYPESIATLDEMISTYLDIDPSSKTLCILVEHKAILLNILGETQGAIDCIENYIKEHLVAQEELRTVDGLVTLSKRLGLFYVFLGGDENTDKGISLLDRATELAGEYGISNIDIKAELSSAFYMTGQVEHARMLDVEIIQSEHLEPLSFRSTHFTTNTSSFEISTGEKNLLCKLNLFKKIAGFDKTKNQELYTIKGSSWLVASFYKHPITRPFQASDLEEPLAVQKLYISPDNVREVEIEALLSDFKPGDVVQTVVEVYEDNTETKKIGEQFNLIRATCALNGPLTKEQLGL